MNIFEIINKSQTKTKLTKAEIFWLVDQFTKDELPDYQMSAWLATVFINHLTEEETSWLTQALCESGEELSWSNTTVDKHSTGGVGDKTSLIIAPLVASLGYKVPMMAGRGLGHTGGTIDKLESIGFQTDINVKNFKNLVETHGTCIMGQSEDFCPADKRLYALRDATQTVANIPLICSSIMSKKIAEGLNGLVLDVKFGTGAFMSKFEDAKSLAQRLISIGENSKIKTYGVLSSMNQPLGRYIGNKLEILECIEIMKDPEKVFDKYEDNILLSLLLSALMLQSINPNSSLEKNFQIAFDQLMSGKVFDKFIEIVKAQNGTLIDFFNSESANKNEYVLDPKIEAKKITVTSDQSGFMNFTDVKALGFAAVSLGAGRFTKEDVIDFEVGFYCHKKQGESVQKSEALFDVYYNDEAKLEECLVKLKTSFEISTLNTPLVTNSNSNSKITTTSSNSAKSTTSILNNSELIKEIISFDGQNYKNIHLKTKFFEV
jgi:pyrimidine-nucleoside phosphorylase